MNILLSGGTGFIGSHLVPMLQKEGHQVTIISRQKKPQYISWDAVPDKIHTFDAVVNLAGENIFDGRWSVSKKKSIVDSRVNGTRLLAHAIANSGQDGPKVFVSASAVGYYGNAGETDLDESSQAGSDFLADVCVKWEAAAEPALMSGARLVHPRIGIALERDGGALERMLMPFQFFVGGALGNGTQFFPWIHVYDIASSILFALENEIAVGPFNAVAPQSTRMNEFAEILGKVMHRPSLFSVPEFVLNTILGEAAEGILASQKAHPKKLEQWGFEFEYPSLEKALKSILK